MTVQRLGRLIVLWDDNKITIDGAVSLSDSTDQLKRFEAAGWRTLSCDGHDPADIDRALTAAERQHVTQVLPRRPGDRRVAHRAA